MIGFEVCTQLRAFGVTIRVGGEQLHGTCTALAGPVKIKVALAGHVVFGIVMNTCVVLPEDKL